MRTTGTARTRQAAATVELAFVLPFLLFVCVIAADWARLFDSTIALEACAWNGAMYACDAEGAAKSPYRSVTEEALAKAPTLAAGATVTAANVTDAGGGAAVLVTGSLPFQTITNFPGVPRNQTLTRAC